MYQHRARIKGPKQSHVMPPPAGYLAVMHMQGIGIEFQIHEQLLRLHILNYNSTPCRLTVRFAAQQGPLF